MAPLRNRIVGYAGDVDPADLLANPLNARRHPGEQREALNAALDRLGWVGVVRVNVQTGQVIDGHARIEEALTRQENVPVLYVDLDEEEERYALAVLDPITGMAVYDADVLPKLTDGIDFEDPLRALLDGIAAEASSLPPLTAPPLDDLDVAGGSGPGGDGSYLVVVECSSTEEQETLAAALRAEGRTVRTSTHSAAAIPAT